MTIRSFFVIDISFRHALSSLQAEQDQDRPPNIELKVPPYTLDHAVPKTPDQWVLHPDNHQIHPPALVENSR
jgi:hypothetical protein